MGGSRAAALLVTAATLAGCIDASPCPTPLEPCGGVCFDLRADRLHCGACSITCGAGLVCSAAQCVPDANAACPVRAGGAFVTLDVCGQAVKGWFTAEEFVARAEALAASPASPGPDYASFDLRNGADCDGQWTWHVDPASASFQPVPVAADCDACPAEVEDKKAFWIDTIRRWCPSPDAPHDARVLLVERR